MGLSLGALLLAGKAADDCFLGFRLRFLFVVRPAMSFLCTAARRHENAFKMTAVSRHQWAPFTEQGSLVLPRYWNAFLCSRRFRSQVNGM